MRKNGERGDTIADPVIGGLQRSLTQILLIGRFQKMVGNVARFRHDEIAVVHRLGDDDGHHAVRVGDLFDVARLQWRQRRQELALFVRESDYVGDIAERHLLVKAVLKCGIVVGLGATPRERPGFSVVVEMLQLSLAQLAIEGQPLLAQFRRQGFELSIDRLAQPGNVHLAEQGRKAQPRKTAR